MSPLSKVPSSAVTVCTVLSLFTQVTGELIFTCKRAGENPEFVMDIVLPVAPVVLTASLFLVHPILRNSIPVKKRSFFIDDELCFEGYRVIYATSGPELHTGHSCRNKLGIHV